MGQASTPKKREASAVSLEKARASRWTPQRREAHAEAIRQAWARRNAENPTPEPQPKRRPGRPKKEQERAGLDGLELATLPAPKGE